MPGSKPIDSAGIKLHNRRVHLFRFNETEESEYVMVFRKLDENREIKETFVALTGEAMDAMISCYIAIVGDCRGKTRAEKMTEIGKVFDPTCGIWKDKENQNETN